MKNEVQECYAEIEGKKYHCPMDVSMGFLGGKWKTVVLWYIKKDRKRFAELKKLIPQISDRMLSITLRQLETDGFILREVFTDKPPLKVEYSLTNFGRSTIPMLTKISEWGIMVSEERGELC